jgi:mannose-6-phosphate isomerase-like protein (cupin superfamily)
MIKKFYSGNKQLAMVIKSNYSKDGVEFLTDDEASLQMGYMTHKKGAVVEAHIHNPIQRTVTGTPEVLIIKKGKMRLDLYTDDRKYVESTVLEEGDIVLLTSGGHGLKCLDNAEMIEVKQGPYTGSNDKIRYAGISDDEVIINE